MGLFKNLSFIVMQIDYFLAEVEMGQLTLAEKILCLITYQMESKSKYITERKLKEILGYPPKSTYYRVLNMFLEGGAEYRPILEKIDSKSFKFLSK